MHRRRLGIHAQPAAAIPTKELRAYFSASHQIGNARELFFRATLGLEDIRTRISQNPTHAKIPNVMTQTRNGLDEAMLAFADGMRIMNEWTPKDEKEAISVKLHTAYRTTPVGRDNEKEPAQFANRLILQMDQTINEFKRFITHWKSLSETEKWTEKLGTSGRLSEFAHAIGLSHYLDIYARMLLDEMGKKISALLPRE